MPGLEYFSITFSKAEDSNYLIIRGDVSNKSGKDYNAVAIRIILFERNTPLLNTLVVVNGLPNGRTKSFERRFEDTEYEKIIGLITRYEIYTESAY